MLAPTKEKIWMNVERDLKKDGISVIKPLDTLSVTLIAKYVTEKLICAFPFYGFNYNKLFIKWTRNN